jgi:hypothetical protein
MYESKPRRLDVIFAFSKRPRALSEFARRRSRAVGCLRRYTDATKPPARLLSQSAMASINSCTRLGS